MAMTFCPIDTDDEWLHLDVENPGHGYVSLGRWQRGSDATWTPVGGARLGQFLDELRSAVLDPDAPQAVELRGARYSSADLRALLRATEHALVLATAGSDRYERAFSEPDEAPAEPLCVNCHLGSPYHQEVVVSERCNDHGHTPFGREHGTWDQAQASYERELRWWDLNHRTPGATS